MNLLMRIPWEQPEVTAGHSKQVTALNLVCVGGCLDINCNAFRCHRRGSGWHAYASFRVGVLIHMHCSITTAIKVADVDLDMDQI